nr:MAG TPA: hypothetical protein [Caudoviricetes sp.]
MLNSISPFSKPNSSPIPPGKTSAILLFICFTPILVLSMLYYLN